MVCFVSPAIVQVQTVKSRGKLVSLCVKLLSRLIRYGEIFIFSKVEKLICLIMIFGKFKRRTIFAPS